MSTCNRYRVEVDKQLEDCSDMFNSASHVDLAFKVGVAKSAPVTRSTHILQGSKIKADSLL